MKGTMIQVSKGSSEKIKRRIQEAEYSGVQVKRSTLLISIRYALNAKEKRVN